PSAIAKAIASVSHVPGFTTEHAEISWLQFANKVTATQPTRFGILLAPFQTQPENGSLEADYDQPGTAKFTITLSDRHDVITIVDEPMDETAISVQCR